MGGTKQLRNPRQKCVYVCVCSHMLTKQSRFLTFFLLTEKQEMGRERKLSGVEKRVRKILEMKSLFSTPGLDKIMN